MTSMRTLFVCLFLSFAGARAEAFDISPEYQGLSEEESTRIERPSDLDAEYQAIVDAYLPRFAWEKEWGDRPRVFQTTVGSITNQHFLTYSRAKIEVPLEETLRFRFTYLEQSDREIDQIRHVIEMEKDLTSQVAIAAYGDPAHYKRSNDIGAALVFKPFGDWKHRLYYTQHDFTRSNHNDLADRFIGDDPVSLGLDNRMTIGEIFTRWGFRHDKPIAWNIPQEGRLFRYEKTVGYVDVEWSYSEKRTVFLRTQADSTFKAQNPVGTSTVVNESWRRDRLLTRLAHAAGNDDDPWSIEVSLTHASRSWINQDAAKVMHLNLVPGLTTRVQTIRRANGFDHFQFGLEANDFKTYGDTSLTPSNQLHQTIQGRAQLAYEFSFTNGAALMIAGNFDVDEWILVPTFEGGNAQFRTEF